MQTDRIEFISEYCDRWCERCPFTMRCSAYAIHAALPMCDGNLEEALELAVGRPQPVEPEEEEEPEWRRDLANFEPSAADIAEADRLERERRKRTKQSPITTVALGIATLSHEWLDLHRDELLKHDDGPLTEAIEIVSWDAHFIHVKLQRALSGRDRFAHDEDFDDDPIQNDWNGSAKIALISIERSSAAWATIAAATTDPAAARLAAELGDLAREVESAFPDVRKFIRPGFDTPGI